MKSNQAMATLAIAATIVISGCANSNPQQTESGPYSYQRSSQAYSNSYGSIESIQVIQVGNNQRTSGAGVVAGAVIGGLLGNQIGGGSGRDVATVAGAVGGAVIGNQIEKSGQSNVRDAYQIVVRLDDGGYQTVEQDNVNDLRIGDRVHVQDGRVYRY